MVPLPEFNSWLVPKRLTAEFKLGYRNVIVNPQASEHCVVQAKYFDTSSHLDVDH